MKQIAQKLRQEIKTTKKILNRYNVGLWDHTFLAFYNFVRKIPGCAYPAFFIISFAFICGYFIYFINIKLYTVENTSYFLTPNGETCIKECLCNYESAIYHCNSWNSCTNYCSKLKYGTIKRIKCFSGCTRRRSKGKLAKDDYQKCSYRCYKQGEQEKIYMRKLREYSDNVKHKHFQNMI